MSSEAPKTYISKKEALKEKSSIENILKERNITKPLKPSRQDYQEAYEKFEKK